MLIIKILERNYFCYYKKNNNNEKAPKCSKNKHSTNETHI